MARYPSHGERLRAREEVTLREFLPGVDAPARLIEATTLVYPDIASGGELLPSARYIDLLREGAAEWNLDEGWQRYLRDRVRSYDPAGIRCEQPARRWRRPVSRRSRWRPRL